MSVPDHRKLASYIIMLVTFTAHSLLKDPIVMIATERLSLSLKLDQERELEAT